jgi:hypothetical protein
MFILKESFYQGNARLSFFLPGMLPDWQLIPVRRIHEKIITRAEHIMSIVFQLIPLPGKEPVQTAYEKKWKEERIRYSLLHDLFWHNYIRSSI